MPAHLGPEIDVERLGFIYFAEGVFELPYLASAHACDSAAGGWYLDFDDEGVATSVHVCACSCPILADAELVSLLASCPLS